ncbi:Os10g0488400, partial [Oryza sativa Japonica Group]
EAPADGDKWAITLATDFSTPKPDVVAGAGAGDDDDDVSMDSMWQTILQSGRARPVTVPKSETWATTTDEQQPRRRERAAAAAVARREIRKSATATNMTPPPSPPHVRAPPAPARRPWRTRDVLPAMPNDELMRRAESLIRRHHEQLRLQRQESEQRQALELQRRRPLIRV